MIFVYETDEKNRKILTEMWMTRGNDECLEVVPALMLDDEIVEDGYTMRPGDVLTLTVRAEPKKVDDTDETILMQISGAPGECLIPIRHQDTVNIPYGQYSADIELLTVEGYHKNLWPYETDDRSLTTGQNLKNFMITAEVT